MLVMTICAPQLRKIDEKLDLDNTNNNGKFLFLFLP